MKPTKERILEDLQVFHEHGLETAFDLQATEFALKFTAKMMGDDHDVSDEMCDIISDHIEEYCEPHRCVTSRKERHLPRLIANQAIKEVLDGSSTGGDDDNG